MARGKGGAKAHGQERPSLMTEKERQICPLCIEPLDPTEKGFFPCPCGYQVCLFCFRRLKEEFSNQCPGCRTVYGSDFDASRRLRTGTRLERPNAVGDASTVPLPGTLQRPVSPAGALGPQAIAQKTAESTLDQEVSRPALPPARAASPLAPIATQRQHGQAGTSAQQQQQQPSTLLQLSQGAHVTPDPDGAALLASTQQRVANGGLSVREAARLLVSFLRAKQAAANATPASRQLPSLHANGLSESVASNGFSTGLGMTSASSFQPASVAASAGKSIGLKPGLADQQSGMTSKAPGSDRGLLSSLLRNSAAGQGSAPEPASTNLWSQQHQQQQPDDELMHLLWGNSDGSRGLRQPTWNHGPQQNGRDSHAEAHVPLYARTRNGLQNHAAARWEHGEKANGMHAQNGFGSHSSWMSSAAMSSELAAIAMSAPPM